MAANSTDSKRVFIVILATLAALFALASVMLVRTIENAKKLASINADLEKTSRQVRSAATVADEARKKAEADAAEMRRQNQALAGAVERRRPKNLAEPILRRPAGRIVRVGQNGAVTINVGVGQQIYRGMTFEIYDQFQGMPRVLASDEQLPVGKGSLEVVSVAPNASECHLIAVLPGQQVLVGDLIANLVYDPDAKLTFTVYGDFDIDGDGRFTVSEHDTIKRLIAEWGGWPTDKLNVDTDVLVMGREPTIPQYTKEQQDTSPTAAYEMKKAARAIQEYAKIKEQALELHIPILNQNRFLYLVGYFDQARR